MMLGILCVTTGLGLSVNFDLGVFVGFSLGLFVVFDLGLSVGLSCDIMMLGILCVTTGIRFPIPMLIISVIFFSSGHFGSSLVVSGFGLGLVSALTSDLKIFLVLGFGPIVVISLGLFLVFGLSLDVTVDLGLDLGLFLGLGLFLFGLEFFLLLGLFPGARGGLFLFISFAKDVFLLLELEASVCFCRFTWIRGFLLSGLFDFAVDRFRFGLLSFIQHLCP